MKILHVSQPTSEGTAVVLRDLVKLGIADGHDVTVACPDDGPLHEWVLDAGARWLQVRMQRSPHPSDFAAATRVLRLFDEHDIVLAHSSKAGAVTRLAGRLAGAHARRKLVFIPHGWSWSVGGRLESTYRLFERRMARSCARIISVSQREFDEGRLVLGPDAPLIVIENSVDTQRWHPGGPVASRGPGPLVVCVGRLTQQKGQDRLIRALAQMTTPDVHLRLVGDGDRRPRLRELAVELRLADRVEFVGSCDPGPQYRAADVVALPSRWEGLSLVLLEAMACGSAIVATADGSSGLLSSAGVEVTERSEPNVVRALANSLDQLLGDDSLRAQLGAAARQLAESSYDRAAWAARHRNLWAQLAQ